MAFLDAAPPLLPMASTAATAASRATPSAYKRTAKTPRTSACAPPRPVPLTSTTPAVLAVPPTMATGCGRIDVSKAPGRFSLAWGGPPGFNMQPIRRVPASLSDLDDDEDGTGSVASVDELDPTATATAAVTTTPGLAATVNKTPKNVMQDEVSPTSVAAATQRPKIHVPRPSAAKLERLKDGRCGGNSCHQCKSTKDAYHLFVCYNNVQGLPRPEAKRRTKARHKACRKKYCARCLVKFYRINPAQIKEPVWFCPGCQGFCSCASCRKKRMRQNVATRPVAPRIACAA